MSAVYHLALADFRERVRRFGFLLVVALAVFLGYQVISGFFELRLGGYRGLLNAAWIGTLMSLTISFFLSLVGFYIVRGNVQQDRRIGVGQILAATPLSKLAYVFGKFASNASVLMVVVFVLALAALAMLLIHGEDKTLNLFQLWMPFLVFSLPVALVTAALAVFFECAPGLRGSAGNVVYFFLWFFLVTPISGDLLAFQAIEQDMSAALQAQGADYSGGIVLGAGGTAGLQTFLWTGFNWPAAAGARLVYLAAALTLTVLAALVFERFDSGTGRRKSVLSFSSLLAASRLKSVFPQPKPLTVSQNLTASKLSAINLSANPLADFATLVMTEWKLLLKGRSFFWYVVGAVFILACFFSPPETARTLLPLAWLWPLVLWAEMGVRDRLYRVEPLLVSAAAHDWWQTFATWVSGILLAVLLGSGAFLRFLSEPAFLPGFFAGALFIPALALLLGTVAGSERPFQIILLISWYLGPLNGLPLFDITAVHDATLILGMPWIYLAASFALVGLTLLARRLVLVK
jgi:hypothetical protein